MRRKIRLKNNFDPFSLWLPLLLLGAGLFAKVMFQRQSSVSKISPPAQLVQKSPAPIRQPVTSNRQPVLTRAPASERQASLRPAKPTVLRRPIQRYHAVRSAPSKVVPVSRLVSTNGNFVNHRLHEQDRFHHEDEFLREVQNIESDSFRENEFLKKKVGLDEGQIEAMNLKRKMFLNDLEKIEEMERLKFPDAISYKQNITQKHVRWMSQLMGPQNYYEYLNMVSAD